MIAYMQVRTALFHPTNILLSSTFFSATTLALTFFIAVYFKEILYIPIIQIGALLSCYGIGNALGALMGGKLLDRFSPFFIAVSSLTAHSICIFLLSFQKQLLPLLTVMFATGICAYCAKTANQYLLLQSTDDARHFRITNLSYLMSNAGLGVTGIAMGLLPIATMPILLRICSLILIISSALLWHCHHMGQLRQSNAKPSKKDERTTSQPTKRAWQYCILSVFFIGLLIAQLSSNYPVYLHQQFPVMGTKSISILFSLDTFLIVTLQTILVRFAEPYCKRLIMQIGAFLFAISMFLLYQITSFSIAVLSCVLWTFGEMLFVPAAQLLCYQLNPKPKSGSSIGTFQGIYALSLAIGPIIGSWIYAWNEGHLLWICCGVLALVCAIDSLSLQKYAKKFLYKLGSVVN